MKRFYGSVDPGTGGQSADQPTETGSGPDGTYCRYTASDITYD
ncbi:MULTISPECIES: hypothetical protein [unclassified Streptomyces]|nr:hypothetical protein OG395_38465 [Streptomyces sp. NBC_01320]